MVALAVLLEPSEKRNRISEILNVLYSNAYGTDSQRPLVAVTKGHAVLLLRKNVLGIQFSRPKCLVVVFNSPL
jgi:hypothetical protein